MGKVLSCAFALLFSFSLHADPIIVHGLDLTGDYPAFMNKLTEIWKFASLDIANLGEGSTLAPEIYLENFDRASETQDLVAWQNAYIIGNPALWLERMRVTSIKPDQVTPDFLQAHFAELYPFPKNFRGFHYEKTNRIQVNPESTFLPYFQIDPYGNMADHVGYGFYVIGHEMTHLALAAKGVPEELHHCIYVTSVNGQPSLMKRMADFLSDSAIASPIVQFYGVNEEVSLAPCRALTQDQRDDAMRFARRLAPGGSYTAKALVAFKGL